MLEYSRLLGERLLQLLPRLPCSAKSDATFLIGVKSAWQSDDPVVLAKKEAAESLASDNRFPYALLTKDDFEGFLSGGKAWTKYERTALI